MKKNIVAITVTYNRTSTLARCLQQLVSQSYPVDDIIIVDNHSSLEEQNTLRELVRKYASASADRIPRIHTIWLKDNLGGAGGFEAGMRYVKDHLSPDYYWIMDDDAYPRDNCLETLIQNMDSLPDAGCVCPLIYGLDLQQYQVHHHMLVSGLIRHIRPVSRHPEKLSAPCSIQANAFVGPLIKKEVVERLGVADGSLFIYGDDTEYTFRISRHYGLYLIPSAMIDHQDAPTRDINMSAKGWWKEYYGTRNQFFMIRKTHPSVLLRYTAYALLILRLLAVMIKSRIKGYPVLRDRLMLKAIRDGLHNRRGKTLDPGRYYSFLEEHHIT